MLYLLYGCVFHLVQRNYVEQLHKTNAFIGAELSSRHKGRAAEGGEVSLLMPSPCLTHEGPMFTRSPAKP